MLIRALLIAASLVPASAALAAPASFFTLDGKPLTPEQIDAQVARLMKANRVTGLAVALIRDGNVAYLHSYGQRDVERGLPLQDDTVMYGASLTKATFAYYVMQLVDEGRIDLDRPIAQDLPRPLPIYERYADLAGDERWRKFTPRMLLSHAAGLPNIRYFEPDQKLHIRLEPGSRFAYSGEGINLLQLVIEQKLGVDVGQDMQRRIFDRFGMTRSSMTWRDDFAGNLTQGYDETGALTPHDDRSTVKAAGSLDTTAQDWSKFLAAVVRGEGLSARALDEMTRLQIPIDSVTQFPTFSSERTDAYRSIKLGYGLGWGVFETPYGHAFFKEGQNEVTANYALCVQPRQACILLMSNSIRATGIFKELVDRLMGPTGLPWQWENYRPYDAAKVSGPP